MLQLQQLPNTNTMFLATLAVIFRFGISGFVLTAASLRSLHKLTKTELLQGIVAGSLLTAAIIFEYDALNYIRASIAAFLTNCYCIIIPLLAAIHFRRRPTLRTQVCCALVVIGMMILANVRIHDLHFTRGEIECFLATLFFGLYIYWLGVPQFYHNHTTRTSIIMYTTMVVVSLPLLYFSSHSTHPFLNSIQACASPTILGFLFLLTVLCTLLPYTLVNHWQREINSTEAGVIYCVIPVFASLFALFMPHFLGQLAGVHYNNESITLRLLLGGLFITLANVILQVGSRLEKAINWKLELPIDVLQKIKLVFQYKKESRAGSDS